MKLYQHPGSFDELPGWIDDDHKAAFNAFCRTASFYVLEKEYKQKALCISPVKFREICRAALDLNNKGNLSLPDARAFFEQYFTPVQISSGDKTEIGLVTGYYEPEIHVSRAPCDHFRYPFYKRPDDLVMLDDPDHPPAGVTKGYAFARQLKSGLSDYPDRRAIDQGYLAGRNLEIAYASSKADVYFTHIQGSARLTDQSGKVIRIGYTAKSGHAYQSIGKLLVKGGQIKQSEISMASIRQWMDENPDDIDELLWQNPSYVFFNEISGLDDHMGPVGAAKVQLSPQRSLAIDKSIYPFGLPIFVASNAFDRLNATKHQAAKLMIAQDTGSAIQGPNRGDIYVGSGEQAGSVAGSIRDEASFYVFVPKP